MNEPHRIVSSEAEELILVGLDRADDQLDLIVLDIHPVQVADLEIVADQRVRSQFQIVREVRADGEPGRAAQDVRGSL